MEASTPPAVAPAIRETKGDVRTCFGLVDLDDLVSTLELGVAVTGDVA